MENFLEELKRRNVFRVALAYVVGAWLVLQVAEFFLENTAAPLWIIQLLMLLFALGLPMVLVFSWVYEITPDGIRRESDVTRSESITAETARKLDIATIAMLAAVLAVFAVDRLLFPSASRQDRTAESTPVAAENSIAVLAFSDLSPEGDQAYFAEGLSEQLLNSLAEVDQLKVAGRTSSFAFKESDQDLRSIGRFLDVAYIVEGSVRKDGEEVRVTAQLVSVRDGFHVFSETYDEKLEDIFAVQDHIAQQISVALLEELASAEVIGTATKTSVEVYDLYLGARRRLHTRDLPAMREARRMLDRALELDGEYAPAIIQKALAVHLLSDAPGAYGKTPMAEALPASQALLDRAQALDEDLAEIYAVRGLLFYTIRQYGDAIVQLEKALAINPALSDAQNWLANSLVSVNRFDDARRAYETIVDNDPLYGPAFSNLVQLYARTRRFSEAERLIGRVESIVGKNDEIGLARGIVAVMRGEHTAALRELEIAYTEIPSSTVVRMWSGYAYRSLGDWRSMAEHGDPGQRFFASYVLDPAGDLDAAVAAYDVLTGFPHRNLRFVGELYSLLGRFEAYTTYIRERFGSVDSLLRMLPPEAGWNPEYVGDLAYAYRRTGNEADYERLLEVIGDYLDLQRELEAINWFTAIGAAQLAALKEDRDALFAAMQDAQQLQLVRVETFSLPMYDFARDDPRFQAIEREIRARVDAQRAELGLPPYRPIELDTKNRPAVAY